MVNYWCFLMHNIVHSTGVVGYHICFASLLAFPAEALLYVYALRCISDGHRHCRGHHHHHPHRHHLRRYHHLRHHEQRRCHEHRRMITSDRGYSCGCWGWCDAAWSTAEKKRRTGNVGWSGRSGWWMELKPTHPIAVSGSTLHSDGGSIISAN